MKPRRIAASLCFGLIALGAPSAHAAIWTWGCQGQIDNQQVIFTRDELYIVDGKPAGKPKPFTVETVEDSVIAIKQSKDKDSAARYISDGSGGGGLEKTMEFARENDDKKKVAFTEKSSKRLSHKHRLICGRDEDSDTYNKVFNYRREDEPIRDIKMQCYEYQLSTRGGRKGCD